MDHVSRLFGLLLLHLGSCSTRKQLEFEPIRRMPKLLTFEVDADIIEQELRDADHSIFERGKGNVCSAEVNPFFVQDTPWHYSRKDSSTVSIVGMQRLVLKTRSGPSSYSVDCS